MDRLSSMAAAASLSLVTAFGTTGCASLSFSASGRPINLQRSISNENTYLFSNQETFEDRVKKAALVVGMSPTEVFSALGLDNHKFKSLTDKELMDAAYAGANPMPQTDEAMRKIMDLVNKTTVYRMNYKHVSNHTAIGLDLSTQTTAQGFDRQLTLIFVNGKLQNAEKILSGNPYISIETTNQIWDNLQGAASNVLHITPKP